MRKRVKAAAAAAIVLLFFLMSADGLPAGLRKFTFLPQWLPQAQFAGYYVAKEKGIYERFGIDLTILRGGPHQPSSLLLKEGKADFATLFLSTGIQMRAEGIPVVNIGQMLQRSGFILLAKKSSLILEPKDLNGKKVSLWSDFRLQPLAFFRKYDVQASLVPQGATINLFLRGGVDVASAMWYNEYYKAIQAGLDEDELTAFFFDRHGLNFPEDGIYCLNRTLTKDRKGVCRFVRASIEGWNYAFDHPEEALDIVMKYADEARTGTNRIHQKWMLERIRDLMAVPGKQVSMGTLTEEGYRTVARELRSAGIIPTTPSYKEFYADCLRED